MALGRSKSYVQVCQHSAGFESWREVQTGRMTFSLEVELPNELQLIADEVSRELHRLGPNPRVGVAYSGGVDSAVLAALVMRAIGAESTVGLLAISPSLARRERRQAHRQAGLMGLKLIEFETEELADENYAENPVDRCYFCKDEMFKKIDESVVGEFSLDAIAYGENADDAKRPDRPGAEAAREHEVLRPLATAGASKAQVRQIGKLMGLPSAAKPAAPCLASRVPHGEQITAEKLHQIDLAEDAVLALGFSDCRVRHHGEIARVEVPADEFSKLADQAIRKALQAGVLAAGFKYVTVDLAGMQSGAFTLQILNAKGAA